jgi:hypothetical protein
MAFYLGKERNEDIAGSYLRYQEYLREHRHVFPPNAFALATAEWYQNPGDHRCPHDGWLESLVVSESPERTRELRSVSIRTRLLSAYHDGHIEFSYSKVFAYTMESQSCTKGLGDWQYDEFRLSSEGHLIHEIEWSGFPNRKDTRWIIEASDVEFRWIPDAAKVPQ